MTQYLGAANWSQKNMENLPRVSSDYTVPYLEDMHKHPEIYQQTALFMDLVVTGTYHDYNSITVSDEAKAFIRRQLEENGTMEALRNGTFNEFISQKAQEEGYTLRRISPDQVSSKDFLATLDHALQSRDARFHDYISQNNRLNPFDTYFYMQDKNKEPALIEHYQRFMTEQNPWRGEQSWQARNDLCDISKTALETGNTRLAMTILRDMAQQSLPEGSAKDQTTGFNFLAHIKWLANEIKKNGLETEVSGLINEYKSRPEVQFQLNGNPLEKARKKLAQKIDAKLGTNTENIQMPKLVKKGEQALAKLFSGKKGRGQE